MCSAAWLSLLMRLCGRWPSTCFGAGGGSWQGTCRSAHAESPCSSAVSACAYCQTYSAADPIYMVQSLSNPCPTPHAASNQFQVAVDATTCATGAEFAWQAVIRKAQNPVLTDLPLPSLLCCTVQVLTNPVYMEDHLALLEDDIAAGAVPVPQLPKHKQVGWRSSCST